MEEKQNDDDHHHHQQETIYTKRNNHVKLQENIPKRQHTSTNNKRNNNNKNNNSSSISFYSAPLLSSTYNKDPRKLHLSRDHSPMRRNKLNPKDPIQSNRFMDYDFHPHEQKQQQKRRSTTKVYSNKEEQQQKDSESNEINQKEKKRGSSNERKVKEEKKNNKQKEDEGKSSSQGRQQQQQNDQEEEEEMLWRNKNSIFQPLRIHFDTTELGSWASISRQYQRRVDFLLTKVLPPMARQWSDALLVVPVNKPMIIDYAWCPFSDVNHAPSFHGGVPNTDLIIYVTANSDVCERGTVLASAFSCFWDQYERPIAGNIDFCLDTINIDIDVDNDDFEALNPTSTHDDIVVHTNNTNNNSINRNSNNNITVITNTNNDKQDTTTTTFELSMTDNLVPRNNNNNNNKNNDPNNKLIQTAINIALHETAHILGITSSDFLFFYDWNTGLPRTPNPQRLSVPCVAGPKQVHWMPSSNTLQYKRSKTTTKIGGTTTTGTAPYYELTTPTVVQVVRNQFDCQRLTGARLENQPTTSNDCFGSHFDERLFYTESMSPVVQGSAAAIPEILSSLTLATLHDSGWYVPNYKLASISPFGHGAGCDFVEKVCIDEYGNVPKLFQNHFCNSQVSVSTTTKTTTTKKKKNNNNYNNNNNKLVGKWGCDPTHTHMAICNLVDYSQLSTEREPPSSPYRYFPDRPFLGGLTKTADYCPTYSLDPISCQTLPQQQQYTNNNNNNNHRNHQEISFLPNFNNTILTKLESYGKQSKCYNTNSQRPICLNTICDNIQRVVKIIIGQENNNNDENDNLLLICSFDGEMITIPGTKTKIECPSLKQICPDMFCPANCAGQGVCHFKEIQPFCQCFDINDTSPGCYNSFQSIPPSIGWDESVGQTSDGYFYYDYMVSFRLWLILLLGLLFWLRH